MSEPALRPRTGGSSPHGGDPPPASSLTAAGALRATGDLFRRVYHKAGDDNIFFLAGAIAFNVIVAFFPLVLAVLGIAGTILQRIHADPARVLLGYIERSIPAGAQAPFESYILPILNDLIDQSAGLLSVGTILLAWLATRLIGTLRTVVREIFDLHQDRGIVAGKIFDLKMVAMAGTLFALNVGLTVVLQVVATTGLAFLGLSPSTQLFGRVVAFATIWTMFLLVYRYLPLRKTSWRTSVTAAIFTSLLFELLKQAFAWYVTRIDFGSTYGTLSALVVLIFWIYYSSVVFILGGEVAQVLAMKRIRRRQKERLR